MFNYNMESVLSEKPTGNIVVIVSCVPSEVVAVVVVISTVEVGMIGGIYPLLVAEVVVSSRVGGFIL